MPVVLRQTREQLWTINVRRFPIWRSSGRPCVQTAKSQDASGKLPLVGRLSMKSEYFVENIFVALLAVNGWAADRVFPLVEQFRAVGLLNFAEVSGLSEEEIADRLARGGYARGEYMNLLLAGRVLSLASVLTTVELTRLKECLVEGRTADVSSTLRRIKGVGPVVLETFWSLQATD